MTSINIHKLRQGIDSIDRRLVNLLNRRAALAMRIGRYKRDAQAEIYVPAREKAIIDNISRANRGPLPRTALAAIYREIMSASLALEKETAVAYLGPCATFSHQAAISRFGASVAYRACDTIEDVFDMVQKSGADYGVVPVENSTEGAVSVTLDRLMSTSLKICAEIYQPISQCLLAVCGRSQIKRVLSHPNVFGQCRKYLRSELPAVEQVPVASTVRAAEMARKDKHAAAIAGKLAAEMYGLKILNANIQDILGNMTRFLVIGRSFGARTGDDKTSILFSVKHRAGSLYNALGAIKRRNLNMTKIESRPNRLKAWEYLFFVDIEGHAEDANVRRALEDLDRHCVLLTVLGSYPRAID